jgi:hypothetical protein
MATMVLNAVYCNYKKMERSKNQGKYMEQNKNLSIKMGRKTYSRFDFSFLFQKIEVMPLKWLLWS